MIKMGNLKKFWEKSVCIFKTLKYLLVFWLGKTIKYLFSSNEKDLYDSSYKEIDLRKRRRF